MSGFHALGGSGARFFLLQKSTEKTTQRSKAEGLSSPINCITSIISDVDQNARRYHDEMEALRLDQTAAGVVRYIEDLTNWCGS